MRDDIDRAVITYARAAEILGVTRGHLRVMAHRKVFSHPKDCAGHGYLLEAEVLAEERARRVKRAG